MIFLGRTISTLQFGVESGILSCVSDSEGLSLIQSSQSPSLSGGVVDDPLNFWCQRLKSRLKYSPADRSLAEIKNLCTIYIVVLTFVDR